MQPANESVAIEQPVADVASIRYRLAIAYRGTAYHGWQQQGVPVTYKGALPDAGDGIPTVQAALAKAIGGVVGHPVKLCGSSRTDAGVHAEGQVVHFDTTATHIPPLGLMRAVNARLPDDIAIRALTPAASNFDAINWTLSKRYRYVIWNEEQRPIFGHDLAWHRWQTLDMPAMAAAARHFVGTHDFASFARPGHGRATTVRTVLACDVLSEPPRLAIAVEGTGFLWHMVRIMVGTLVEVGLGRRHADDVPAMLAAADRRAAGPTAPPHGLYLQHIRMRGDEDDRRG